MAFKFNKAVVRYSIGKIIVAHPNGGTKEQVAGLFAQSDKRFKAVAFYMTSDAFEKATGTTDKELFLVPGATHIKTYYELEFVEQEVAKLTEFFGKRL